MAMTIPIAMPSTASPASSDDTSNLPRTPVSANDSLLSLTDQSKSSAMTNGATQMKRKSSRRANTAERRATHNAVERQRRETLNGRFLDLAALLPNLSQIRRPSKSSIVNSSIAHIHASRRHRAMASRELRCLKIESDAIRRELNEWRDRAGLPRVEEPIRSEGFTMVLNAELEVLTAIPDEDEENGGPGYDGYDDGEDEFGAMAGNPMDDLELKNGNPFTHNLANSGHLAHMISRSSQGPMIVSTSPTVSFENPAMSSLYEPNTHPAPQFASAAYLQQHSSVINQGDIDKVAAWNAQLFSALAVPHQQSTQLLPPQRTLFTPPATSHGIPSTATGTNVSSQSQSNAFTDHANQAFLMSLQRQQHMATMQPQQPLGHVYGSPDAEDSSSVGSVRGQRERSGSLSGSASGYGSPHHGSSPGGYEMPMVGGGDYGAHVGAGSWACETDGMGGMGLMKQNLAPSISVGGGGNGSGFAMML